MKKHAMTALALLLAAGGLGLSPKARCEEDLHLAERLLQQENAWQQEEAEAGKAPEEDPKGGNAYQFEGGNFQGLFDAVEQADEKEQQALEEALQEPFYAEMLSESAGYGECALLQHHYDFNGGRKYSAYLFRKSNSVDAIIDENELHHYSSHKEEIDGVPCVVLSQYGRNGKQVVLAPEFRGHTLVLIEEGLQTVGAHPPIPEVYVYCSACGGTGDCAEENCSHGKCRECGGVGRRACIICGGSGYCKYCYGTGTRITSSGRLLSCSACHMTGKCPHCKDGHMDSACYKCNGSGNCLTCGGSGHCARCGGDGNLAM